MEYISNKESLHLQYLDANNLYGCAMSHCFIAINSYLQEGLNELIQR
jgi:hypothetical protein